MFKKGNKKIFSKLLPAILLLVLITVPFFANVQAATEEGGEKCGWTNMAGCVEMAWGKLVGSIADLVLSLAAFVTYAAGTLLDFVIKYTIVDMSANVGVITGISTAWSALRDLANIFFIFILLYAAIATVLQLGGVNTKKIITRVIIIALLINFSLFFTRVMIDVSNALSVGFYNAILSSVSGSDGISYAYMQKLLLATVYQPGSGAGVDLTKFPEVGFLGAIFFLVAAFVFLAAAVLFISRFVVLIFLMILSAPAFAAMALPSDKYSSKWWDALWSQLIFAPVFFILSWATLQVLKETLGSLGTGASLKDALVGSIDAKGNKTAIPEAAAIFANFGIAITFMIATLTVAKSLAGTAGKGIQNFVGGVVGGATLGGVALAGRRLIGGYGARVLRDENLKEKASKGDVGARLALQVAGGATKASFDVRNTGAGKHLGLGKGAGKGGYAEKEKQQTKRDESYAKLLAPSDVTIDQAQQKADAAKIEIPKLKEHLSRMESLRESSDREFLNEGGEGEIAHIRKTLEGFETAQSNLNTLKGVSEKDARAKGIQPIESLAKVRQKQYAEKVEKGPFIFSWLASGDRKVRAAAIRKMAKGKTKEQKAKEILEEYKKDEESEGETERTTSEKKPEPESGGISEKTS